MKKSSSEATGQAPVAAAEKRVILSMGGKGGVGKTSVITGLAEWFDSNQIPLQLMDLDSENKARGSLAHFFGERAPKINIHMVWGGKSKDAVLKARRDLLAVQRSDGGWSDIASMESGAFTTGLAMMALQSSGLPVSDPAYQRGVKYLLNTQLEDGSWHVPTRAAGFQPYFDNGFPHGVDQWISAAGTSLATIALTLAAPPAGTHTAAVTPAQ
jgi:hypothetical protein